MFTDTKKAKYARLIGLSIEEFQEFTLRLIHHLNKGNLPTQNRLIQGFFILENIMEKRAEKVKEFDYKGIRNIYIKKYAVEILNLSQEGLGSQRISNHLKINHSVSVSRSTIQKFINNQNTVGRGAKNG